MGFHRFIIFIIDFIFGLAEILLGFRVLLEFFNANRSAAFTSWILETSQPLLDPFRGIFPSAIFEGNFIIDFSALFAIVIYALINYLIISFIEFVSHASDYRSY